MEEFRVHLSSEDEADKDTDEKDSSSRGPRAL